MQRNSIQMRTREFTVNSRLKERDFSANEADLALVIWIRDPETNEERQLTIPFSLLTKLWPELTATVERLEEVLRE
jgi:hypothetical protein